MKTLTTQEHGFRQCSSETLQVVRIQRSCVHDGTGLRSTIFFRGCGLECKWCHNPETRSFSSQVGDEFITTDPSSIAQDIAETVLRDKKYYLVSGGGVTLSGGEPFLQNTAALEELLKLLKAEGIHITAETALHAPWENIQALMGYIDMFIVDLKAIDTELHKELTNQTAQLIHENLEKLVSAKVPLKLRMLMVPGLNDGEEHIKKTVKYIKTLGLDSIELMRYHNMHEGKAERLGLDVPLLGITPDQSLVSLKKGIELFNSQGIAADNDELRDKPPMAEFTPRVKMLRDEILEAPREISFEVARLKTEYYKKFKGFKKPVHIHRAERLHHVMANKTIKVYDGELLVGNFTEKRVAGQLWEEQYGSLYATFLHKAHKQTPVPFIASKEDKKYFYKEILFYWLTKNTIFRGGGSLSNIVLNLSRVAETSTGFNNNFAAIAHFVVNFERVLKLGTNGMKKEIEEAKIKYPENNQDFYNGALISIEALELWSERYAAHLEELASKESDPKRRAELEKMAEICNHVPKNPARTFHEALQSMMFLHMALCIEAYENAISFGRFDQILYPYFKADFEAGRITYEEAKELLCLFVIKMDEVIIVNDGDGVLNISKLFETLSVDQALTFGGVGKDGKDATNDVTYMCIDACELQPLAINMCARIHKDSPQKYLDRLAEIYINGCPMPELFSDDIYIESLLRHYDTSIENARNYSIVGCVEPVASDDHFGNTDSANMNLALPLLQAMKGHEHDLWHFGLGMQIEKLLTRFIEYGAKNGIIKESAVTKRAKKVHKRNIKRGMFEYSPPKDMDELLTRFRARLGELAKSVLDDQQTIEKALRNYFTTPLASSLYKGCIETGKDAYEGGTNYRTAGIQAVAVTDVADSLHVIEELVYKQKKYTILQLIQAIDANFEGYEELHRDVNAIPKFGDDSSPRAAEWVSCVMGVYNDVLDATPYAVRDGKYTAGYY
ncbi:MAG: radical SAM protein, partial [Oscillospiraceae bacterium]|nr:radical SAM protein [Oscillospiraceae bacterium]